MEILKFVLFAFAGFGLGSCDLTEEEETLIDNFMEEIIECFGMPGASISLVRNDEIELARGYGFANIENEEPFTADSRFAIASVTKSMTCTLAAKLFATTEDLSWDTFARDVLGEDFHFIDGYRSNNTMLRDLVSHQTGIPGYDALWILDAVNSREEIVMERVRFMEELNPVRSDFLYTSNMYSVLGLVLEETFGATWEELMTSELFAPIGMDSSTLYDLAAPDYEDFITPYTYNISSDDPEELVPWPYMIWSGARLAGPGASACSSANDMALWMQFVLSDGLTADGERLVNEDDMRRLWYPESAYNDITRGKPFAPVTDSSSSYGLGYTNGHYRGYRSLQHGGTLDGFHSDIFLLPDMNISSFYHTNFGGSGVEQAFVHRFMADVLLGVEPAYNASVVCALVETPEIQNDYISENLDDVLNEDVYPVLQELGLLPVLSEQFKDEITSMAPLSKRAASNLVSARKILLKESNTEINRNIENYLGQYGNFAHGNITVESSNTCEGCLYMEYGNLGQYTLYPTNTTDFFIGYNVYPLFEWTPVTFSGEDDSGNAMQLVPLMFSVSTIPVFERGLLMSEAPMPRNDLCGPAF